ncbi:MULTISPECIES: glycoside hydrolase family 32 protein [unclassified Novosphingobium]|uniref:glycoside hydrolase family 32 protein n=1 Tax=unclassified Novosphingobium TaxID=2644732 RepID=UPI00146DBDE8|nr:MULTISPECIES: glycoside hydrolase family 32 protein [unclassified Novosphingobium]NMN05044.1 levanase/fructan beta-fructosidase [Novosphingobium sp. SG919]NMN87338.1 levanase/fructan beta-fructosidase [Novosphingobium sp. SG916]
MTTPDEATPHYRPDFHFTPQRNWINDPNGLVYFEGEYHLFFQYNPHGKDWGHMSWGHAISTDLVQWEELPVAMPEREFMIFSGSVVVDWANTSGFGIDGAPPLVALYTAFHPATERQSQHVAYSHDRGRSWIEYPGNPVITAKQVHFRDPKVFWHAPSQAWVLVVALARDHKVQIYRSANLIDWQLASEFGPAGHTGGQWECPDLFEAPMAGQSGSAWALKVDVDKDMVCGASGAQVFIGTFDGHRFTPLAGSAAQIVDMGPDFYAAQCWSDLPGDAHGPLWIGWMSNHLTGKDYPTHPWRGAMTIPRELHVKDIGGTMVLAQRPARQVRDRLPEYGFGGVLADGQRHRLDREGQPLRGQVLLRADRASQGACTFAIAGQDDSGIAITLDFAANQIRLRRGRHPALPVEAFAAETACAMPAGDTIEMTIIVDASSVELFVNDGAVVLTACHFPLGETTVELIAHPGARIDFALPAEVPTEA